MMTRKNAIKMLVGLLSGLILKGQDLTYQSGTAATLARLSFGKPDPKAGDNYNACLAANAPFMQCNALSAQLIPGTAKMTLYLDGWEGFQVELGGQVVVISRQDIWDALTLK